MQAIRRSGGSCLAAWILCVTSAQAASPPRYDVKLFERGSFYDVAAGGRVLGSFGRGAEQRSGIWSPETGLRAVPSIRATMSDSGVYLTGDYGQPVSVWSPDGKLLNQLDSPANVFPVAVNSAGTVAGTSGYPTGTSSLWSAGGVTQLQLPPNGTASRVNDINELGQAGGTIDLRPYDRSAVIWNADGSYTLLERALENPEVLALNNVGEAVGVVYSVQYQVGAYWKDGKVTTFEMGAALDINDAGTIVGGAWSKGTLATAKIWVDLQPYDLNTLVTTSLGEGWRLTSASGISSDGWIIGHAMKLRQVDEYTWEELDNAAFLLAPSPVPEPGTYALMLGGLALLGAMARRRAG